VVQIAGMTLGRAVYEPGWRWTEHVGPTAGTALCEVEHVGLVVSGHAKVQMRDGEEHDLTPGDIFAIPGGHESWVVGDEPYVSLHLLGAADYARGHETPAAPPAPSPSPVSRRDAEHYSWGACCDGWFLVKREDLHVIEERLPPAAGERLHLHRAAFQFFYVLAGAARFAVEGASVAVGQCEGLSVSPGLAHRVDNAGPEDLSLLVISAPPSHGDRVDVGEPKAPEKA